MELTELEQHIIDVARKHPEFDESVALSEIEKLRDLDIAVRSGQWMHKQLWAMYEKSQKVGTGDKNVWNCALAYFLGITTAKPQGEFHLQKRRAYARPGFPDVDMDFDHFRRHEIVEYMVQKYGRDCVGNIGTVQRLKTKAAVRRAIKVLDPTNSMHFDPETSREIKSEGLNQNFALENEILKTLPGLMKREDGSFVEGVEEACAEYPDFGLYMEAYPQVKDVASHIEETISGYGAHAAGVVLSPEPLATICPLHQTTSMGAEKTIATQFAMSDVESLGLIKFDILGLKTKTAMSMAQKLIQQSTGKEIDLEVLPLDDRKTFELIRSGKTDGCFQLENSGMKETLRQIGIDEFEHLIIAIAMYRPGPKDYIPLLADRKARRVSTDYMHPKMKDITQSSYGILAFQEQVMMAFVALSGLSVSAGLDFTKGCAKKKQSIIDGYEVQFMRGCKNNNIPEGVAAKIWNDMKKFGGYAFNRSHAASYAEESFKTAYLKAHYPTEFMAARLTVELQDRNFDDVDKYEADCIKNLGFTILDPDLNKATVDYRIIGEGILMRPMLIKGIGQVAAEDIVKHQPYKGPDYLYSFAMKVGSAVNSKVMAAMYDAGLFGDKLSKDETLQKFEIAKEDKRKGKGKPKIDMFK